MANDKKFIVKNGLQSEENVVIGSNVDNGTDRFQVTGSSKFTGTIEVTQNSSGDPSLKVINTGGFAANSVVASFEGDSDALQIINYSAGDYKITNNGQNNGIVFTDDTGGLIVQYNNLDDLAFDSTGIDFKRAPTVLGDSIWYAGNDGTGSGLDADLLDGLDSLQFLRSDENDTFDGDLVITGDLTVQGTRTELRTETVLIDDNIITLNSNFTSGTPTENAGFEINRGDLANSSIIWDETNDWFKLISAGTDLGRIITTADEGSGNGFDADTVDGLEAAQFLRADADDTATGNITIEQDLTIGDDSGGAQIIFNGSGQNRNIFSNNGQIGFLNSGLNYSAYSAATGDWIVENNVRAKQFVDADNVLFFVDPGGTSEMQTIELEGSIRHRGDTDDNTFITFPAEDEFSITTGGTERFKATNTLASFSTDIEAPLYYDSDNQSYYGNFAGISVINTIWLDGDLAHNGDTNTKIHFDTDTIKFDTNGVTRLTITDSLSSFSNNVAAAQFLDSDDNTYYLDPASDSRLNNIDLVGSIRHDGDTNTFITFDAADSFQVTTGGAARYTQTNASATFGTNVYAPRYYDSNDTVYFLDPAGDSQLDTLDINDYIRHRGDLNTYFGFDQDDRVVINTNGTWKVRVDTDTVDTSVNVISPNVGIDADLFHNGNTGTKLSFGTNIINLNTGNVTRLQLTDTAATFSENVYAPRYYDSDDNAYYVDPAGDSQMNTIDIDDYIRHRGDLNTYIGFSAEDTVKIFTGGTERVNIDNDSVDFAQNVYAPRYYDSDNNTYYVDPASDSVLHALGIDDDLFHNGDTDTKLSFATDAIAFSTGGAQRFGLDNDSADFTVGVYAPIYYDTAGTTDFLNLGDTGANDTLRIRGRINVGGGTDVNRWDDTTGNGGITLSPYQGHAATSNPTLSISGANGGYSLAYWNRIDIGNNPFTDNNRYFSFMADGVAKFTLRGDASGNQYNVSDANQNWYFMDSGASGKLAILNSGEVIVNNDSATYSDGGDNTALTATPSNPKLHVDGSIYLNGANDGIIFGRGTASFLKDEELAFGWGGGWYMTDATYLRVRNNKTLYSTGDFQAARFVDSGDTTYYLDPANSDVSLKVAGEVIAGNGSLTTPTYSFVSDPNTGMYRKAADTIGFSAGGNEEMNIYTTYVDVINELRTHKLVDRANTSYSFEPQGVGNGWRLSTPSGYIDFGPMNASYAHIQTDRDQFYFNKKLVVDEGIVQSYNEDLWLRRATSSTALLRITNGTTISDQNVTVRGGTVTSAPTKLMIESAASTTAPGDMYGQMQFVVPSASGVTASGITGTDVNTIAMITAEDFRPGTGKTNEDSGIGFYTTLSGGTLQYNGGISSTGTWYVGNLREVNRNRGDLVVAADTYSKTYYDLDNASYYGNFAATSIMNTVRANRFEVEASSHYIDRVDGDYGTIRVEGTTGGYAGYAINNDWVFMSNGATNYGLYNDTDNEWSLYGQRNDFTRLYANGAHQIGAENGYGYAPNKMRAPIFEDSDNTAFYANFAAGNTGTALNINGQINRTGFATGDVTTNKYLVAEDRNHWIWNTATDWGIFWATTTSQYSHYGGSNPNEIIFVGNGNKRAAIDLDNGSAFFSGQLTAGSLALNGGNEDLSLLKNYGTGMADQMVFDGSDYWEKRVINALQGIENSATGTTAEFVKSDGPFTSSYALRTNAYRNFYTDYILVEPGEELYIEQAVKVISGSGGRFYYGLERYDKDKRPIAGNTGTTYLINTIPTSTSWNVYRGYTTIPTSHTPYNGSDGGGCKYVRIRILMNYNAGGALREFGPPILKRSNYKGRLRGDDIFVTGDADVSGNMDASVFRDRDNTTYAANLAGTSLLNTLDTAGYVTVGGGANAASNNPYNSVSSTRLMFGSRDSNAIGNYFIGTNMENYGGNYTKLDLRWHTGIRMGAQPSYGGTRIFNNEDLTTLLFSVGRGDGNTRVESGTFYSPNLYDINDTNYFINPGATGQAGKFRGRFDFVSDNNETWLDMQSSSNGYARIRMGGYAGDPFIEFSDNTNGQSSDQFFALGADDRDTGSMVIRFSSSEFASDWTGTGSEFFQLKHNGQLSLSAGEPSHRLHISGTGLATTDWRAPIFYDSNDTGYYLNPASTSRMEKIRFEGTDEAIELNSSNPYIRWMESGTDRFYIQWRGSYDAPLFRNQQGDNFDFMPDASTGGVSLRLKGSDDDIWGYVYASDSEDIGFLDDQGQWAIRHNRDSWTYFYINNSLRAYVDTSSLQHVSSVRAPIFYDRNNTAFYINPDAGNTYGKDGGVSAYFKGALQFEAFQVNNNARIFYGDDTTAGGANGDSDVYNYGRQNSGQNAYGLVLEAGYGGDTGFIKITDDGVMIGGAGDENLFIWYDEDARANRGVVDNSGNMISYHSMRAPIFYDYNNTGYYTNPASTSVMHTLDVRSEVYNDGWFRNDTGGRGLYSTAHAMHWYATDDNYWDLAHNDNDAAIGIRLRGTYDGDIRGYFYGNNNNDVGILNADGSWRIRVVNKDYVRFDGSSIRAKLFYDLDNTGYYMNPAGNSNISTMDYDRLDGPSNSSFDKIRVYDDSSYAIGMVSGRNYGALGDWAMTFRFNNDDNRGFWWGDTGHNADQGAMSLTTNGRLTVANNIKVGGGESDTSDPSYTIHSSGAIYSGNSMRAPIFYDANDTNYYTDPAGTSRMASITLNGGSSLNFGNSWSMRSGDSDDFYLRSGDSDHGRLNFEDSGGTDCGELYWDDDGSVFAMRHDNGENIIYSDEDANTYIYYNNDWQLLTYNGYARARQMRADLFYDQNNTSYYADMASTSRFNYLRVRNLYNDQERQFWAPEGSSYTSTNSSITGTLKIQLPTNRAGANTMVQLRIVVYEYNHGRMHEFRVGGYNYSGSTNNWTNVSATQISDSDRGAFTIRFCDDGSDAAICIGDTNYTWVYPQVHVTEVQAGYSGFSTNWGQDYDISITTSYPTIRQTRTASIALTRNNASNMNWNLYSTRYYSQDSTGYYTDPSSVSNMNVIYANRIRVDDGGSNGHIYSDDTYIDFRYGATGGGGMRLYDDNGSLQGYWYGNGSGENGILDNDGAWAFRARTGSNANELRCDNNHELSIHTTYVRALGSFRAPIFYDYNDTAYYSNQAGTSKYQTIQAEDLQSSGNVTAYVDYSDIRYKEEVEIIDGAVEKVKSLDGITYKYIGDDKTYTGVVAQQVEEVLPGVVYEVDTGDANDPGGGKRKAVNYGNMVGLLIESTKEQQEIIENQQKEIDSLKEMVYNLIEKLNK